MISSYERACKEAGLSEEKTAEIRRFFDAGQKNLKYLIKSRMEHHVCQESLEEYLELSPEKEPMSDENVESEAILAIDIARLRAYMQELEEEERIFLLRCFDGTTERELAEEFGMSRAAMRRKRESLVRWLRGKFTENS